MKTFIILCSLFIITSVAIHEAKAEQSSLEAQLEKNYKSLLRQQQAEREMEAEAARLKPTVNSVERATDSPDKKHYESLLRQQAAERERVLEASRIRGLQEEEARKKHEAEQAAIDAQNEAHEEALQKQCGNDYKNLRVGMKLDRVQKCVAEFFLRGQVKTKNGVVDHYTRGDSYIYVKKGKVVAWGG